MMTFKIIAMAIITAVSLPVCAKHHTHNCEEVVEQAYMRIESAITHRPELTYSPIRTEETGSMFMEACRDGFKHGRIHDTARLNMLYESIETRAHQPKISTEEARYLLNDTVMVESFLAGYEIGSGEG